MALVLASASPRRAELLRSAGIPFLVDPVDVDESVLSDESPMDHVHRLARAKASAGAAVHRDDAVLGADTVVTIDGTILGKPRDETDARRMLRLLSGREHEVLTGVAVWSRGALVSDVDVARVRFAPMTAGEIDWYIASGEPMDKAGAYGVQGRAARFIDRLDGSWSTVVGLPVATVYRLLRELPDAAAVLGNVSARS
jgi:septum formation protein